MASSAMQKFSFKTSLEASLLLLMMLRIVEAYKSYVVGGDTGWIIPTAGSINYTAWASNITFSLGDSLDFHYSSNHTVVQTDSLKTYESCDSNADDNSLQIWSSIDSTGASVQLTRTGDTYFFCSAYDGEHCLLGMKFQIHVNQGAGLPPAVAPTSGSDDNDLPGFEDVPGPPPPPPPELNSAESSSDLNTPGWAMVFLVLILSPATMDAPKETNNILERPTLRNTVKNEKPLDHTFSHKYTHKNARLHHANSFLSMQRSSRA